MTDEQKPDFLASLEEMLELIAFNVAWFYLGENPKYQKVRNVLCSFGPNKNYLELALLSYSVSKDRVPCKLYEMIYECQQKGREKDYASMFSVLMRILEAFNEIYTAKYGGVPFKLNKEVKALALKNANIKIGDEKTDRHNWILNIIRNIDKERLGNRETVKTPLSEMLALVMTKLAQLNKTGRGFGKQTVRKILIKRGYLPARPGGHA